jgi:hypothetical protein
MTRGVDEFMVAMARAAVTPYGPGRMAAAFFNSSVSTV